METVLQNDKLYQAIILDWTRGMEVEEI